LALLPDPDIRSGFNWIVVPLMHLLVSVLLLFLLDPLILREIRGNRDFKPGKLQMGIMIILVSVMLAFIGYVQSIVGETLFLYGIRALFCLLILTLFYEEWKQARLLAKNAFEKRVDEEKLRYYESLNDVIQSMNIKAHDLRHQIRTLQSGSVVTDEVISELSESVSNYENYIHTGNPTLDVLLTEAAIRCEHAEIEADFQVSGECLSFMPAIDLNALFGNAIDNAIEYLQTLPVPDRLLWVTGGKSAGFVKLRFENRLLDPIRLSENGIPATTKQDTLSHGFGTQSIQKIAQKYNGSAVFTAEDEVFSLCVIIPLPEQTLSLEAVTTAAK
jgi:hypothetical protein